MPIRAERTTARWHPAAGPLVEWLTAWVQAGWVPDRGGGVWASVGGREALHFPLIRRDSPERGGGLVSGIEQRPEVNERIERQMRETLAENDVPPDEAEVFVAWLLPRLWDDA